MAPYLPAFVLGLSVMSSLWVVSVRRSDASLVDYWWAPGFAFGGLLVWLMAGAPLGAAQIAALGSVCLWAARMTRLFIGRRARHPGEDPRYTDLRAAWGPGFWWKSLFVVFFLQAVLQWIVAAPVLAVAVAPAAPLGATGCLGLVVALAGLALEARADAELDAHKAGPSAGRACTTGLRAYVRYPNYLGEIVFWLGLWLIAGSAGAWWSLVGPLVLIALLIRVSGAPILDERLAEQPGGREWLERTPAFLPRLGQRAAGRSLSR